MKKLIGSTLSTLFLTVGFCSAQTPQSPSDSQPESSNVRGAAYPRINTYLRAQFQVKAPDAQKVQILLGKTYEMVRMSGNGRHGEEVSTNLPRYFSDN